MEAAEFDALQVGSHVFVLKEGNGYKWDEWEITKIYRDALKEGVTARRGIGKDKWAEERWKTSFFHRQQIEKKPKPKPEKKKLVWMCHETGEWATTTEAARAKFGVTEHYLKLSNLQGVPYEGKHYYRTLLVGGVPQKLEIQEVQDDATCISD